MPIGIAKPVWLSCVVPVLVSSFLWLEKESVEVDSEVDKPGKPNLGLTHQLTARCHHCHELGRAGECVDQPVQNVTTKIVSVKYVVRSRPATTCRGQGKQNRCSTSFGSRRTVSVKYVVDEERDRRKWRFIEFSWAKPVADSASVT